MGIATRVVPVLLADDHGCVKGRQFGTGRRIGSLRDRLQLLDRRDIDELLLLDIVATPAGRGPQFDMIADLLANVFCPVTVGGGVRNVSDVRRLLASGADKVAIGTAAYDDSRLIIDAAQAVGSQAIVVAIDVKGGYVATHCGTRPTYTDPIFWAEAVEMFGAGEILLTSVDRDGMMNGYDIEMIRDVSAAVSIPVVAAGGCGSYEDMAAALTAGAHAVAAGAFFQFREATPKGAARHLSEHGVATRL